MDVVNIFLTNPAAATMDDFIHGEQKFVFGVLDGEGPGKLVDGPVWAFVDWVMEDMAGLEMCRRLRADHRTRKAHITMVLEANEGEDRRRALEAGADDYMLGPLDRTSVLDRVLAIDPNVRLRHAQKELVVGDLSLNILGHQARWAGAHIDLAPNEFRLLRFLAENPDRIFSRQQLVEGVGKHNEDIDARTVDVWMGRLRRAMRAAGVGKNDPLRTVRSKGYIFRTP